LFLKYDTEFSNNPIHKLIEKKEVIMALKKFKKFILEASDDSLKPVSKETKRLMDGFYCIVSQKKYEDVDLEAYLNKKGYDVTRQELRKIRNLHVATDYFFEVHNRDY